MNDLSQRILTVLAGLDMQKPSVGQLTQAKVVARVSSRNSQRMAGHEPT